MQRFSESNENKIFIFNVILNQRLLQFSTIALQIELLKLTEFYICLLSSLTCYRNLQKVLTGGADGESAEKTIERLITCTLENFVRSDNSSAAQLGELYAAGGGLV